jgi:hypothetical protein
LRLGIVLLVILQRIVQRREGGELLADVPAHLDTIGCANLRGPLVEGGAGKAIGTAHCDATYDW